jgi:hypothetical protein
MSSEWQAIPRRNSDLMADENNNYDVAMQGEDDDAFVDSVQHQQADEPMLDGYEVKSIFQENACNITGQRDRGDINMSESVNEQVQPDFIAIQHRVRAAYNPDDEPEETISINETTIGGRERAAYLAAIGKAPTPSELVAQAAHGLHLNDCSDTRGATTPPAFPLTASPTPGPAQTSTFGITQKPWEGPDPAKDIPSQVVRHKEFHDRVREYKPKLKLISRRYWIGVLNEKTKPQNAKQESDFTWMKGNRFTTVETVWQIYSSLMQETEFVLMLAGERFEGKAKVKGELAKQVKTEELDYFNDKMVIFRIVQEHAPEARGRGISEGLVTRERVFVDLTD